MAPAVGMDLHRNERQLLALSGDRVLEARLTQGSRPAGPQCRGSRRYLQQPLLQSDAAFVHGHLEVSCILRT